MLIDLDFMVIQYNLFFVKLFLIKIRTKNKKY